MNKGIAPPHLEFIAGLMDILSKYSKASKRTMIGQVTIEPMAAKNPPTLVMYCCNEAGRYMVWFADEGKFHLYANVNGKTERIISVLAHELHILQRELDKLKKILDPDNKID
jgi:hypothetical protein